MKNNVKRATAISFFIVFAILMIFVTIFITNKVDNPERYFSKYNKTISNELKEQLQKQASTDEKIQDIIAKKEYTFDNPYIYYNPYDISPLSALVIFSGLNEEINLYINDNYITTIEKNNTNVIPIYGLYANYINKISLISESGKEKTFEIKVGSYNDFLYDYNFEKSVKQNEYLFALGNLNSSESLIRGFDYRGNLISYINLSYISSVSYHNNSILISYNNMKNNDNKLNICLEIDYLGRILSISTSNNELVYRENVKFEKNLFYTQKIRIYEKHTKNYTLPSLVDNNKFSTKKVLITADLADELIKAKVYDKNYKLMINGSYITYDFKEESNINLLLVNRNNGYTYSYTLDGKGILKIDYYSELSVYLNVGSEYYTLLTTLKN